MDQISLILAQLDELSKPVAKHVSDDELKPLAAAIAAMLQADSCTIILTSEPAVVLEESV